jgi:hypothetical protein
MEGDLLLANPEAAVPYYDVSLDWVPRPLRSTSVAVYPYAQKVYRGMDWLGGRIASAFGLTSSRFQYAIDEYESRERRRTEKEAARARAEREQRKREAAVDEDDTRMPYVPQAASAEFVVTPETVEQRYQAEVSEATVVAALARRLLRG